MKTRLNILAIGVAGQNLWADYAAVGWPRKQIKCNYADINTVSQYYANRPELERRKYVE